RCGTGLRHSWRQGSGDRNSGRTVESAKLRHCAGPESKSGLGLVAKRSTFPGFDRQGRRDFGVEFVSVSLNRGSRATCFRATHSTAQSECWASICVYIEGCTIISANQDSSYDRLLRGGKKAQSLSGGRGVHHCWRRHHPTGFCYISSLGIAKLVAAIGNS